MMECALLQEHVCYMVLEQWAFQIWSWSIFDLRVLLKIINGPGVKAKVSKKHGVHTHTHFTLGTAWNLAYKSNLTEHTLTWEKEFKLVHTQQSWNYIDATTNLRLHRNLCLLYTVNIYRLCRNEQQLIFSIWFNFYFYITDISTWWIICVNVYRLCLTKWSGPKHKLLLFTQRNLNGNLLWQPSCRHVWSRVIVPLDFFVA